MNEESRPPDSRRDRFRCALFRTAAVSRCPPERCKIAELAASKRNFVADVEALLDDCRRYRQRIQALESENRELRDALVAIRDHVHAECHRSNPEHIIGIARRALAKPEPAP